LFHVVAHVNPSTGDFLLFVVQLDKLLFGQKVSLVEAKIAVTFTKKFHPEFKLSFHSLKGKKISVSAEIDKETLLIERKYPTTDA
jgi:hypothetical protein